MWKKNFKFKWKRRHEQLMLTNSQLLMFRENIVAYVVFPRTNYLSKNMKSSKKIFSL